MFRKILLILLLIAPSISFAICIVEPIEKKFHDSKNVFIATITSATIDEDVDFAKLKSGQRYKINYTFVVAELFKGSTTHIKSLQSQIAYDNPLDDMEMYMAESTKFIPGDSLIVFADNEEVSGIGFCTVFNLNVTDNLEELRKLSRATQ